MYVYIKKITNIRQTNFVLSFLFFVTLSQHINTLVSRSYICIYIIINIYIINIYI